MRIAVKYSMDDVQVAIAGTIQPISPRPPCIGRAIGQLAFIAEFTNHIYKGTAIQVFKEASTVNFQPTVNDLKPLMAFPAIVVVMMEYREVLRNPQRAPWNGFLDGDVGWLNTKFESFGFKPQT